MARRPVVAGTFYSGDTDPLMKEIEHCFLGVKGPGKIPIVHLHQERKGKVLGLISPHAGYVYSGSAAAHAYSALAVDGMPEVAVIMGPNHHGLGSAASVASPAHWITPLGMVHIDTDMTDFILANSKYAQEDDSAHMKEHSIEVQIPFLQFIGGHKVKIVPISIAHLCVEDAISLVDDLGNVIAKGLEGKNAVIIASTDFTHYESQESVHAKDAMAIEKILAMDPEGLIRTVDENSISMCGATGTAIAISACKQLGAVKGNKLAYYTSGDITGDMRQVVGYAAISLEK